MKGLFMFSLAAAAVVSCARTVIPEAEYQFFMSDAEDVSDKDLGAYVDGVGFVPLSDSLLVGQLNKLLVFPDMTTYVSLDSKGDIQCFYSDGNPGPVPCVKGRAGNEYASALDIACHDSSLIVLENRSIKIFPVAGSGNEIRKTVFDVGVPVDAIAPCGDGKFFLFSAFSGKYADNERQRDSLLYVVSEDGETVSSHLGRKDCTFSLFNISQSKPGEYILRPQNSDNIFYELGEAGLKARFRLDFGDKNIPSRYYFDVADEDIGRYMLSEYYKLPMECYETEDYVSFRAAGPEASETGIIFRKSSGRGIYWSGTGADVDMRILASDGQKFICIVTVPSDDSACGPLGKFVFRQAKMKSLSPHSQYLMFLSFDIG